MEKKSNEFKLLCNKQIVEEILIEIALKTTIQILYDNFFYKYDNADGVLTDFLLIERRRPGIKELNDVIQ